jgi:NosR/NirI family nitrous oxide reductase transcriptional regulator
MKTTPNLPGISSYQTHGWTALIALLLLLCAGPAMAELIATPEFADHPIPTAVVPDAPASWWQAIDIGVLFVALALASYLALVKRSRRYLFILTIASLGWFGFWRGGCICPIGAIQNVSLAAFDTTYVIPLTVVAFFVLPLVFTLFFGRTFCAAVCPLGAAQELVAVRSVTVPPWLDHALGLLRYIYLGAAVLFAATGTAFVICRYDPFVAFFRLSGSANMLVFGGSLLLIGVFVGRPYCRYLCPYGAILGLLSSISKWHVRIPPNECINCRLCEDVCPYGAIQPPTIDQPPAGRQRGRRRLVGLLAATPLLVAALAWLGTWLAEPLARMDPEVRLAEQVHQEELGLTDLTTDASDAFRATGRLSDDLYATASSKRARFGTLGGWLGGWVGLVVGLKLCHLSVRRRRVDYRTDRSGCVSCARCFWYCPNEQLRLGLIQDVSELIDLHPGVNKTASST